MPPNGWAAGRLGGGWAFGVREALDSGGAMIIGPLVVTVVLVSHGNDRAAFAVLGIPAALTLVSLVVLGIIAWGLGRAAQESVIKALSTSIVPTERRASAVYGLFDTGFGVTRFAGSILLGLLYDTSLRLLAVTSAALQLVALPVIVITRRRARSERRSIPRVSLEFMPWPERREQRITRPRAAVGARG